MWTFGGVKQSFKSEQDDWFQPKREAQIKLIPIQGEKNSLILGKAWQQINS